MVLAVLFVLGDVLYAPSSSEVSPLSHSSVEISSSLNLSSSSFSSTFSVCWLLGQLLAEPTSYRAQSLFAMKGRFRCSVPQSEVLPVFHGPGKSRFMRDWTGPFSLCNFVLEKTGTFSSFFLRSFLVGGLDLFGVVSFFRGTSSPLCGLSSHPGYLIGDGFFLDCFPSCKM